MKIFLIFPKLKILTFEWIASEKVNKFGLKKSKFVFFISIRFFCEGLQWNYRSSESNPRCFFSAFHEKCKYKFQQKIVRNLPIIIRILTHLVKWQLLTISILSSASKSDKTKLCKARDIGKSKFKRMSLLIPF